MPVDRNMIDIGQFEPAFAQAIIDRARRQTGPMFDPAKALLFRRGDEFAVDKQTRGGIGVVSV